MADEEKVRHFRWLNARGYWQPSKTLVALGMSAEALGSDMAAAAARARHLNAQGDALLAAARKGSDSAKPGSCARLFADFERAEEFQDLKPRTRADYSYYLGKIEAEFGKVMVRALTPKVLKTYYRRLVKEKGVTWAYHIMSTFRTALTWAVSEDWIKDNPAKKVRVKSPKKRDVVWTRAEMETYLTKAADLGWGSIVAMVHVFDSIGQSPIDVRTLTRGAYDGDCIDVSRKKTGRKGAPIILFPDAAAALDDYLATQLPKLPSAPLFLCEATGEMWGESHLQRTHAEIRTAAGLRFELQMQDFRTTAQTEGGASGGTVDELRGLARHSSRSAGEHYVYPDRRFVDSIQAKRLALRQASKKPIGSAS